MLYYLFQLFCKTVHLEMDMDNNNYILALINTISIKALELTGGLLITETQRMVITNTINLGQLWY